MPHLSLLCRLNWYLVYIAIVIRLLFVCLSFEASHCLRNSKLWNFSFFIFRFKIKRILSFESLSIQICLIAIFRFEKSNGQFVGGVHCPCSSNNDFSIDQTIVPCLLSGKIDLKPLGSLLNVIEIAFFFSLSLLFGHWLPNTECTLYRIVQMKGSVNRLWNDLQI